MEARQMKIKLCLGVNDGSRNLTRHNLGAVPDISPVRNTDTFRSSISFGGHERPKNNAFMNRSMSAVGYVSSKLTAPVMR